MRRALLLAGTALLASLTIAATLPVVAEETAAPAVITLDYKKLPLSSQDPGETKVGRLLFRGGLAITSTDKRFGGWSGLKLSNDGRHLLSQSDESHWLTAELAYDKGGNLIGIADGRLVDMQDLDGRTMTGKEGDAEGLAVLSDKGLAGPVAVSFERNHRIWRYDLSNDLTAKPTPIETPEAVKSLRFNAGLESLVLFKSGTLLTIAESADATGNLPAWLVALPGSTGLSGVLSVKAHAPYEVSDAAMSPDGKHLYLLERHFFDPIRGVVIAVREIDASTVKPGAQLDGVEIASFTMRENIDNMEGLALRRGSKGETVLTMISDDNYNPVQRTVLLNFEVLPQ